jgi:hypothetical protein
MAFVEFNHGYEFPPNITLHDIDIETNALYTLIVLQDSDSRILWCVQDIQGEDFLKGYDTYQSKTGRTVWSWEYTLHQKLDFLKELKPLVSGLCVEPFEITLYIGEQLRSQLPPITTRFDLHIKDLFSGNYFKSMKSFSYSNYSENIVYVQSACHSLVNI